MTDKPLADRIALVTGASRGIGAATARALGAAGAHVILTARTAGGLEEVEEAIYASGGSATIAPMDLTENESVSRLAAAVAGRWPALDLLVLNAASLGSLSAIPAIDFKEFAKVLTLNVTAQAAMLAAFENLLLSYGEEVRHISGVRVGIVDPGSTRTKMRARAFPGENPDTVKAPEVAAERIVALAVSGFETGHFERVD